jgi:transcriptional regulator GlxA family with amidase domain
MSKYPATLHVYRLRYPGELPVRVGILVFDEVEELDFVGPLEVFGQTSQLVVGIEIIVVSKDGLPVRCRYGLTVQPDRNFDTCPTLDLLIVPGGKGAREHARYDPAILSFVRSHASRNSIASVCTGALILAEAGLLKGHTATTHWSAFGLLRQYPEVEVKEGVRFVRDRGVSTSAGISAGIDLALAIVNDSYGEKMATEVARHMEYPYPTSSSER